ncbi:MAG: CocE/NonD family hydrolase, partial [Armatimonadota bacterium]
FWNGRCIFDREHYSYVVVDWRGFYESRVAPGAGARSRRGEDGYDVVEWIAQQPWSNGRLGTWGPSALGKIQFMTAIERPPHLVCCVPIVAANGFSYDDFFANGVRREAHVNDLERLGFGQFADRPIMASPTLLFRFLSRLPDRVERINVPMLMITGWYDHGVAQQLRTFRDLRTRAGPTTRANTKLLIGPWHHSAIGQAQQGALRYDGAKGESDRAAMLFFDYWLRDQKANGWAEVPSFRWWQINEGKWFGAERVAGPETSDTILYLHADGVISAEKPAADERALSFTDDPNDPVPTIGGANLPGGKHGLLAGPRDQRPLEDRDDVLVYTTRPMQEPLRAFGSVSLRFSFSVDAEDAAFAVRLSEVYPDGRSMLICDSITRARYRNGPEQAAPVEPGIVYGASVVLPPTALTIQPGRRLRVSISGSDYPRFQLNDHSGADAYAADRARPAMCTIFHDEARPATLTVPILR